MTNATTTRSHSSTISDDQIRALRVEAEAAGDDLTVGDCDRALRGVWTARRRCALVIREAQAQSD